MKLLNNLPIAVKLVILVGITLLGLVGAGVFAASMMQREMYAARTEQTHAIVESARSMALDFQKQVQAGKLTRDQAVADYSRRLRSMTYDNGSGYLFAYTMDGVTVSAPDSKQVGTNRLDVKTNGRALARELRDGVAANGSVTLNYEYRKPGSKRLIRKMSYAVAIPGWDMFVGTGAYLDDINARLWPLVLGLAAGTIALAVAAGLAAWLIGRSITRPLGQLGARMQALAEGELDSGIPGIGRKDEIGAMAATVQVFRENATRVRDLERSEVATQQRAVEERRAVMQSLADDFERSVNGVVHSVTGSAAGMQATAESMTGLARDASSRALTVSEASQKASGNAGGESPGLWVQTKDRGKRMEIRIRDNGAGIPKEIRDKIFNPFFTTKPTGEGTGLGLSMTHEIIVQEHHGSITVNTEAGQYSEFVIELPKE